MALKINKFVLRAAVATMVLASSTVSADNVHDQAAFDTTGYGWDSFAGNSKQQIADDFRLKQTGKITNLLSVVNDIAKQSPVVREVVDEFLDSISAA